MRKITISVLAGLMTLSSMTVATTASAEDCGFPPSDKPTVPNGKQVNRVVINATIGSLKAYGETMNIYLDCMTEKKEAFFNNMNKEQQARWVEDYNALADGLEELQNNINREIRVFNLTNKLRETPKTD